MYLLNDMWERSQRRSARRVEGEAPLRRFRGIDTSRQLGGRTGAKELLPQRVTVRPVFSGSPPLFGQGHITPMTTTGRDGTFPAVRNSPTCPPHDHFPTT